MSWFSPRVPESVASPGALSTSSQFSINHGDIHSAPDKEQDAPRVSPDGATQSPARLSVREALRDKAILITGATGYLGSVMLEQLLRVAGDVVGSVYVLARGRGDKGARERVGRVLGGGLFNTLRQQHAAALRKIVVLEGDLAHPNLGLSAAALDEVAAERSLVIVHSAARIALDDPIQDTLRNNYEGTRRLLEMVETRLHGCVGFVHVSTAFVGMNLPHNSTVPERLLPLMFGDQRIDHARLARELLSASKEVSDTRATLLCRNWNLPNTYLLGKHMAESLVEQYHREGRIGGGAGAACIVRPSLVSALFGAPYPGFVGNLAGPSGIITAFALGFYNKDSPAWHAWHLLDSVPGDVAAAVTLAAAAALASGIRSREQLHDLTAAATTTASAPAGGATAGYDNMKDDPDGRPESVVAGRFLERANESYRTLDDDHYPLPPLMARPAHLRMTYEQQQQRQSAAAGGPAGGAAGLASSSSSSLPGELLVFHAATSTINPCLHVEAYDMAYRFFKVHKAKFRLGGYVRGPGLYSPVPWKVELKKRITGIKVAAAAGLLSCFGQQRTARKLRTGFHAWKYANSIEHDKTLFFSIRNVLALERCLPLEEGALLPLVFRSSWNAYANTYMAGVCRLFMNQPVPPSTPQLPHAFTFIPPVVLEDKDLPPLAGSRGVAAPAGVGGGQQAGGGDNGMAGEPPKVAAAAGRAKPPAAAGQRQVEMAAPM